MRLEPDVVVACFGINAAMPTRSPTTTDDWTRSIASPMADCRLFEHFSGGIIEDLLLSSWVYSRAKYGWISLWAESETPEDSSPARATSSRLTEEQFRREMLEIVDLSKQAGAAVILISWPCAFHIDESFPEITKLAGRTCIDRRLVRNQGIISEVARAKQCLLLDLRLAFQNAGGKSIYVDGVHSSSLGGQLAAQAILHALREAPPALRRGP